MTAPVVTQLYDLICWRELDGAITILTSYPIAGDYRQYPLLRIDGSKITLRPSELISAMPECALADSSGYSFTFADASGGLPIRLLIGEARDPLPNSLYAGDILTPFDAEQDET